MAKLNESRPTPAEVIGTPPKKFVIYLTTLGLLTIVVGTIFPIFLASDQPYTTLPQFYKYIFAAGAVILLIGRLFNRYNGCVMRVRRLVRIEAWSAIFFCTAAFFLFYETESARNWLAFTMAGAVLQVFTSIMIPRALKKALNK